MSKSELKVIIPVSLTFIVILAFILPINKNIFLALSMIIATLAAISGLFFAYFIGFLLQNYAIFLGSVALVNALQGVQYAFLLVLGGLISVFYPNLLKENISTKVVIQKLTAVLLISIGLYFLAF